MQWAVCYILVFQHFIICISYLGSVLDWKPCVLPTDWLEWRGSRDHNPPYLTTLHLVFILIILIFTSPSSSCSSSSSWPWWRVHPGPIHLARAARKKLQVTHQPLNTPSLHEHFVFVVLCILCLRYFLFCILYLWYFLFSILYLWYFFFYFVVEVLFLLFCICTTFSFVFCICCNKYSVISTKLDDSVKYIWKTKTASLHGWSRIQKSLLKRMH